MADKGISSPVGVFGLCDECRQIFGCGQISPVYGGCSSCQEISPEDALKIGLNGHKWVRVRSRRGEMVAKAIVTERVSPGLIFGNFHFPGRQNVNNLTIAALDPVAKIPEYKVCAVKIEPADL